MLQKIDIRVRDRERYLANRAKRYGLNSSQVIEMRALEATWEQRDLDVMRMWDAGAAASTIREPADFHRFIWSFFKDPAS